LQAVRATWAGLPTIYKEQYQESANPCLQPEIEVPDLVIRHLDVQAGFTLTDPNDTRYQHIITARQRFGEVSQRASSALRQNTGGEDHTDAIISVTRAIDTYLLGYGLSRSDFDSIQKNYAHARE
jgi:proteasome activator subunit 4